LPAAASCTAAQAGVKLLEVRRPGIPGKSDVVETRLT
jgi:hypothetical protein